MSRHRVRRRRWSRGAAQGAAAAVALAAVLTTLAATHDRVEPAASPAALEQAPVVQEVLAAPAALTRDRPTAAERRRARLAELAEKRAEQRRKKAAAPTTSFRVASINTLGDSHTAAGGNKARYASGVDRTRNLIGILTSQGVDVAGLQEFEVSQRATFNRLTSVWQVFTGTERGHDSIVYRGDVWEFVTGGTGTIPYFHGNPVPMPWVTLRHRATGREVSFISIHNPTSNPQRGNNAAERAEATRREIAMVRTLAQSGNPVLLLGDFNERSEAFCAVTGGGDIGAANGGSVGGSCAPPPDAGIDWIFGTTDIGFSDYLRHQDAVVARTTDHPVIVARATITEPLP